MSDLRQLTGPICRHGEGPFWSPSWGGLRWIDMLDGDVMRFRDDASVHRHHVADRIACIRPRDSGGAVVAVGKRFAALSAQALSDGTGAAEPITGDLWQVPDVWFNEGGIDPQGRFWCGSAADDSRTGAGVMHRLNIDGTTVRLFGDITISNGLAWSPDGACGYYVDSATNTIARIMGSDDHPIVETLIEIEPEAGEPDGLCVDATGAIWVAMWGGSCVRRYDPTGALLGLVAVPAPHVTACALGDDDLRTLYITTSQQELDVAEHPESGSLFSMRVDDPGFVTLGFAG